MLAHEPGLAALDEALETTGLAAQDVEGRGGMRRESAMLAFKAACQDVALGHLDVAAVIGAQAEATSSTPAWTAATWTGFQASTVRS